VRANKKQPVLRICAAPPRSGDALRRVRDTQSFGAQPNLPEPSREPPARHS